MDRYVCAFRGRRDAYAVPLALAEAGRLDRFITDAWAGPLLRRLPFPEKFAYRREPGIPDARVRCLWGTTAREHWQLRRGRSPTEVWARLDAKFSLAAADRVRRTGGGLFLYSPYAWEAFTASYPGQTPRRIMFQYHPHSVAENRLLDADLRRFPEMVRSHAEATGAQLPEQLRRRTSDAWRHADRIICASSFTRDSLLEVGADPSRCIVLPYGVESSSGEFSIPSASGGEFRALFVGSGVQRKGLHHLLRAWESARLPAGSKLTLVCRNLEPGIEERVARTRGVKLLRGASALELRRLYAASTLFVLPSLVEGFGQVYLEALAAGCPTLGTVNTCLPDLGGESEGIFLVAPGDVDALTHQLERLAGWLPEHAELRGQASRCASAFTWGRFRAGIAEHL